MIKFDYLNTWVALVELEYPFDRISRGFLRAAGAFFFDHLLLQINMRRSLENTRGEMMHDSETKKKINDRTRVFCIPFVGFLVFASGARRLSRRRPQSRVGNSRSHSHLFRTRSQTSDAHETNGGKLAKWHKTEKGGFVSTLERLINLIVHPFILEINSVSPVDSGEACFSL